MTVNCVPALHFFIDAEKVELEQGRRLFGQGLHALLLWLDMLLSRGEVSGFDLHRSFRARETTRG